MSQKLHISQLRAAGACTSQVHEFKVRFGNEVEITPELCASVASVFNFGRAAHHLLSPLARAEFERVSATAWNEYERVRDPAWAEYGRATATVWAEYERVCARTFADCYNRDSVMLYTGYAIAGVMP